MEIELKLLIDPKHTQVLRNHPLLKQYAGSQRPQKQQMLTTYFDTPDLYFSRHRAALRVRHCNGAWVQALKDGNQVQGGLHSRNEWETEIESDQPDLEALREMVGQGSPWFARLANKRLQERITPVFSNRIDRTAWLLTFEQGQQAELVLDQGELVRDDKRDVISEIELEVISGDAAPLFDFALKLLEDIPLRLGNASKSARGYAMMHPAAAPLVKAQPVILDKANTVEEALGAIADNCIMQLQGNEAGVIQGNDPEHVHQMRVGLRRLRSLLKLFEGLAPLPAGLDQELRWLSDELGAARDWEILAVHILSDAMHEESAAPLLPPLQQAVQAQAYSNRARAAEAVGSVRYTRLLLNLIAWLHGRRWQALALPEQKEALAAPVVPSARQTLKDCERRLKRRARNLAHADAPARHRLRIAAKRMRYAMEFFSPLFPQRQVRPFVQALARLQDSLGQLNDAAVAQGLLHELAQRQAPQALAAGFVCGQLSCKEPKKLRKLCKRWKAFRRVPQPG